MLLTLNVRYPLSYVAVGHHRKRGSYISYILKRKEEDGEKENHVYEDDYIITPYKWNHMCVTYCSEENRFTVAKVHAFLIAGMFWYN